MSFLNLTHLLSISLRCFQTIIIVPKIHIRPNKKNKCVSGNRSKKFFGRIGTHIFFRKKYNFMHFERHFERIFFLENLKKILGFSSKFR